MSTVRATLFPLRVLAIVVPLLVSFVEAQPRPTASYLNAAQNAALNNAINHAQNAINGMPNGPERTRAQAALSAFKEANAPRPVPVGPPGPGRVMTDPEMRNGAATSAEQRPPTPPGGVGPPISGNTIRTEAVGVGNEYVYLGTGTFSMDPAELAGIIVHEGNRLLQVANEPPLDYKQWPKATKCNYWKNELQALEQNKAIVSRLLPPSHPRIEWLNKNINGAKARLRQEGC